MEGIQLSVEKAGAKNSISVIKIGGYIDTTTSSELEHALNSLLRSGQYNIIIDLGNVDYVSSAGWGIFISEIKGIREKGGDLKLVRMIPEVYEVFELLEFHYILKAFDELNDAIKDFERSGMVVSEPQKVVNIEVDKQASTPSDAPGEPSAVVEEPPLAPGIEDKVKKIISMDPEVTTTQLVRTLRSPQYGNIKIGWFAAKKVIKKLGLDSKKARRELANSHQG